MIAKQKESILFQDFKALDYAKVTRGSAFVCIRCHGAARWHISHKSCKIVSNDAGFVGEAVV